VRACSLFNTLTSNIVNVNPIARASAGDSCRYTCLQEGAAAATGAESTEETNNCVGAAPAKRPPMERAGSIRLMDKSISIKVCYNISLLRRPRAKFTFEVQQGEKDKEAWGDDAAGDLKPRVRLRRHVLDVLCLGHIPLLAHCGRLVRYFTSNLHRSCQVTCSSCLATTPLSAGARHCLLSTLISSPALRPHTPFSRRFSVVSVEDWTLSGDRNRSAVQGPGDDGVDDQQPKAPVHLPQSRSSQILTIEDEQPTAAVPVLNPPRTASFLQRLLAACACGSRQGKMNIEHCFCMVYRAYSRARGRRSSSGKFSANSIRTGAPAASNSHPH
jgi:hypothetical protein